MKTQIPVNIQGMIDSMNDKSVSVWNRENFRLTLMAVKTEIEKAVSIFEKEKGMAEIRKKG